MSEPVNGVTVAMLLYGRFPELARRCLGSILLKLDAGLVPSLRIGLNDVCDATRQYVYDAVKRVPAGVEVLLYDNGGGNQPKYQLMRRIFYDTKYPVLTQFLSWFDDDSCLSPEATTDWWDQLHRQLQMADVVGALYRIPLRPGQSAAIEQQPWYTGMHVHTGQRIIFPTGAWWAARTSVILENDYPFTALSHNGGDVMLGALCMQRKLRLVNFRKGVWINADMNGRESKAQRRGRSEMPIWAMTTPKTTDA